MILSHRAAAEHLAENPTKTIDVVLITNSGGRYDDERFTNLIKQHANRLCHLVFDDVDFPRERHVMVEKHQIQQAIDFAADKHELVVTCTAGMSRSAGLAYIIACSKMDPSEAVTVLDPNRHTPNEKVVFLGHEIVNKPTLLEVYARFLDEMNLRSHHF